LGSRLALKAVRILRCCAEYRLRRPISLSQYIRQEHRAQPGIPRTYVRGYPMAPLSGPESGGFRSAFSPPEAAARYTWAAGQPGAAVPTCSSLNANTNSLLARRRTFAATSVLRGL